MSNEEEDLVAVSKKRRKVAKNEFIDDEAELSGDDEVSEDELELSDDDQLDLELVDKEAAELDSEEEEEEQLEDKDVSIGQRRRRKFRWQTKELMENSLRRHYDPDDDESQSGDDEDEEDYSDLKPRLRRPTAETLLIGSTRIMTKKVESKSGIPESIDGAGPSKSSGPVAFSDDSNSNTISSRLTTNVTSKNTNLTSDMNRYLFRDKELVEALSTKETVITSREEKNKVIQRELKKVLQSTSIFDQLYS